MNKIATPKHDAAKARIANPVTLKSGGFCRSFARRIWRTNFADKQLWRNVRHPGAAFSFRIFTGRCAA